jgi:hypothetical protein
MCIHKGSIVKIRATVRGFHPVHKNFRDSAIREIRREEVKTDQLYLVVGKSYIATGIIERGGSDVEYWAHLNEDCRHPVWIVELIENNRFYKPLLVLESDLEIVNEV